jgi:hypothetical protein
MTGSAAFPTAPDTTGIVVLSFGWTEVAVAVARARRSAEPTLLTARVDGHAPLVVDVAAGLWWWDADLTTFPAAPGHVDVVLSPRDGDEEARRGPGRPLAPLMWLVGLGSFPGELAWWLQPDDRHRLTVEPDLTTLPHEPAQAEMIGLLAAAPHTVKELSTAAAVPCGEARRVVNALSVAGLLSVVRPTKPVAAAARGPWLGRLVGRLRTLGAAVRR